MSEASVPAGDTGSLRNCGESAKNNWSGSDNDSGVSCGSNSSATNKNNTNNNTGKAKSQSPADSQKEKKDKTFHNTFPSFGSDRGDYSNFFEEDPFFAEKASKFFGKSRAGKPRLSERLFENRKGGKSVFDDNHFVSDLKKKLEEERKMFFEGAGDSFASAFGGRASSPVGGSAGRGSRATGSGFPDFDELRSGARARLDEFANRHPMFSTMRNQPDWNIDDHHFGHHRHQHPHGFDSFHRDRNNSGSSAGGSAASTGEERVIPIQILRDDDEPPKPEQGRGQSPAPPTLNREKSPQPQQRQPSQPSEPQRSNTVPNQPHLVDDNRASRAQSAPPVSVNGNSTKSNTKSAPQPTEIGVGSSKTPKSDKQGAPSSNTNNAGARSIPIVVENRKGASFKSTPNGSSENYEQSPAKVSRPAERSPTPPSKKPAPPKDPLAQVNAVLEEVKELEKKVDDFKGNSREDREYLVLDEMLTRCLIKLDVVEADGRDDVRTARKECIKYIQNCISKLEKKTTEKQEGEVCKDLVLAESSSQSPNQAQTEAMDLGSQQENRIKSCQSSQPKETSKVEHNQTMDADASANNSNTNTDKVEQEMGENNKIEGQANTKSGGGDGTTGSGSNAAIDKKE